MTMLENDHFTNNANQIKVEGGLTINQAHQLKARLIESCNSAETLDVDLSEVSEIDTAGLQLLLALRLGPKPVTFIEPSPILLRAAELLNMTGLLFSGALSEES
jgi:ABC-type transporter Mla MlaB component